MHGLKKCMPKAVLKTENISIRLICEIFGISSTVFRYQAKTASENRLIEMWLLKLTQEHKLWGYNNERPHSAIGSVPPCQLQ